MRQKSGCIQSLSQPVLPQVTNILKFLVSSSPHLLRFLVSSERTGYRHLYLVEATPPPVTTNEGQPPFVIPQATVTSRQLTAGEWVVFGSNVSQL